MPLKDLTQFLDEIKKNPVNVDAENLIQEWITVTYDITGNALRNEFRDKLVRLGAIYQNDSTYLVPKKIIRDDQGNIVEEMSDAERIIEAYAQDENVRVFAIGMKLQTREKINSVSQAYKKQMLDWIEERKTKLREADKRLVDILDEVKKDPKEKKITGLHRILKGLERRDDDLEQLVIRYGNSDNQFDLNWMKTYEDTIRQTYKRILKEKDIA